jgi:hypothetical protein
LNQKRRILEEIARAVKARDETWLTTVTNGDKTVHLEFDVTLNTIQRVSIRYTVQAAESGAVATIAGRCRSSLKALCIFAVNEAQRDKGVLFRTRGAFAAEARLARKVLKFRILERFFGFGAVRFAGADAFANWGAAPFWRFWKFVW